MALEAQLQRPDSNAGELRQSFQIERLGRVRLKAFPRPLEHGRHRFAMRGRPIDRMAEIVRLTGEKKPDDRLAQGRDHDGRKVGGLPAMLGKIDEIFDLELKCAPERRVEVDPRFELDRTYRFFRQRRGPVFDLSPVHQQNELRAIILPDHPGRQRRGQQRRHAAWPGLHLASCGPDFRPAADRHLQQEETIKATRIDRHRAAVSHIVHRKPVKPRAVVQRVEIRPGMLEWIQCMRAENSPDRLRSLIDIGGMNAGVRREPRDGSGIVDICNGCVRHHGLVALRYLKPIIARSSHLESRLGPAGQPNYRRPSPHRASGDMEGGLPGHAAFARWTGWIRLAARLSSRNLATCRPSGTTREGLPPWLYLKKALPGTERDFPARPGTSSARFIFQRPYASRPSPLRPTANRDSLSLSTFIRRKKSSFLCRKACWISNSTAYGCRPKPEISSGCRAAFRTVISTSRTGLPALCSGCRLPGSSRHCSITSTTSRMWLRSSVFRQSTKSIFCPKTPTLKRPDPKARFTAGTG